VGEDTIKKEKLMLLVELGRFRFLAAGFFLYTLGFLLATIYNNDFSITYFLVGYAIMMPAHLSLSYSNNYFDIEVDKYNKPVSIAGGSKTLIEHPDLIPICKYIAIFLIIISITIAAIFVFVFSYSYYFLLFVIFGNLLGWFYTAPPLRLAYRGLGEIANMINMGFLMPGIGYWVMNGSLNLFFFVFAIPLFIYGLEFMALVETPDMEGDIIGKKLTLIAKLGRKTGYKIILVSLFSASLYFLIIALSSLFETYLNFYVVFIISLIPLLVAMYGWGKKPFSKVLSTKIAEKNMSSLVLIIILLNIYFLFEYVANNMF
jgi:1,4-dihydroxy-2-naphthoate octaprenyltransferase